MPTPPTFLKIFTKRPCSSTQSRYFSNLDRIHRETHARRIPYRLRTDFLVKHHEFICRCFCPIQDHAALRLSILSLVPKICPFTSSARRVLLWGLPLRGARFQETRQIFVHFAHQYEKNSRGLHQIFQHLFHWNQIHRGPRNHHWRRPCPGEQIGTRMDEQVESVRRAWI